jgi:hypothetical protein
MSRLAWVLVLLAGLVPTGATPAQSKSGALGAYWEVVPGTRKCALYVGGYKVGLWNPEEEKFYRINVDGSTTGPVAPPWRNFKLNAAGEYEAPEPPPEPKPEPVVEEAPRREKEWYEDLPPWTGYLLGAGVTLIITGIGLGMQFRKT